MKLKTLLLLLALVPTILFAQDYWVNGIVIDEVCEEPMQGVLVKAEGMEKGIGTDEDGKFRLEVNSLPTTLSVQMIGYMPIQMQVTPENCQSLFVVLMEETVHVDYFDKRGGVATGAHEFEGSAKAKKKRMQQLLPETVLAEICGRPNTIARSPKGKGEIGSLTLVDSLYALIVDAETLKKCATSLCSQQELEQLESAKLFSEMEVNRLYLPFSFEHAGDSRTTDDQYCFGLIYRIGSHLLKERKAVIYDRKTRQKMSYAKIPR